MFVFCVTLQSRTIVDGIAQGVYLGCEVVNPVNQFFVNSTTTESLTFWPTLIATTPIAKCQIPGGWFWIYWYMYCASGRETLIRECASLGLGRVWSYWFVIWDFEISQDLPAPLSFDCESGLCFPDNETREALDPPCRWSWNKLRACKGFVFCCIVWVSHEWCV